MAYIDSSGIKLEGLGGWLVFAVLGLFVNVLFQAYGLYEIVLLCNNGTVVFLNNPSSGAYISRYGGLIVFELIIGIAFLNAGIYLIRLFFKKSGKFPMYYIFFLAASVIFMVVDYMLLAAISSASAEVQQRMNNAMLEQAREIIQGVISAVIWGTYMIKSKRVAATFAE